MLLLGVLLGAFAVAPGVAIAQSGKPNILVIWGDDIGEFNISAYNTGQDGLQDAEH